MMMIQNLTQKKARSIDNPACVFDEIMAHSFSEGEFLSLKAGIRTNRGTAPDHIGIFLRFHKTRYSGTLSRHGKTNPFPVHFPTVDRLLHYVNHHNINKSLPNLLRPHRSLSFSLLSNSSTGIRGND